VDKSEKMKAKYKNKLITRIKFYILTPNNQNTNKVVIGYGQNKNNVASHR
jgi:hypothetical protein